MMKLIISGKRASSNDCDIKAKHNREALQLKDGSKHYYSHTRHQTGSPYMQGKCTPKE